MGRKILGNPKRDKGGRPFKLTALAVLQAFENAKSDETIKDVAKSLNVVYETLYTFKNLHPEIARVYDAHTAIYEDEQVEEARKIQYNLLKSDNEYIKAQASRFILNTRGGWSTTRKIIDKPLENTADAVLTNSEQKKELEERLDKLAVEFKKKTGRDIDTVIN